jgi:hypothetical protein
MQTSVQDKARLGAALGQHIMNPLRPPPGLIVLVQLFLV